MSMRKALETLYDCKADIIVREQVRDSFTDEDIFQEVTAYHDIPCRISFSSSLAVDTAGEIAKTTQSVKLFINPDISIRAGSKIIITGRDSVTAYAASGFPARYPTHQEIGLELWQKWA